jgi:thiol-disulfide isomerase/thioredoxin
LVLVFLGVTCAATDLIEDVRNAIAENDFSRADGYVREYRDANLATPDVAMAMSWLARGTLGRKLYDQADAYARWTYQLSTDLLKRRSLDQETNLPIALGAAIEVHAQVLAAQGQRSEALTYLAEQLTKYGATSIHARIQKNIHLLSLVGKPAPALETVSLPKGKLVLLFFWAHWCGDCLAEAPVLARLKAEFSSKGLVLIGPTQKYGYIAGGEEAAPQAELRYIEAVRKKYYGEVIGSPATVNEENFRSYGVSTTPTLVLIDRGGIVRMYHPGALEYGELRASVERLL